MNAYKQYINIRTREQPHSHMRTATHTYTNKTHIHTYTRVCRGERVCRREREEKQKYSCVHRMERIVAILHEDLSARKQMSAMILIHMLLFLFLILSPPPPPISSNLNASCIPSNLNTYPHIRKATCRFYRDSNRAGMER